MSGLDVEALLESTAAETVKTPASHDADDHHKSERNGRRDRDRHVDDDHDRDRDRKRRDRGYREREDDRSPRSDRDAHGRRTRRRSRSPDSDRHRAKREHDRGTPGSDDRHAGDFYRGGGRARSRSGSRGEDRYYRPSGNKRRDRDDDYDRRGDTYYGGGRNGRRRSRSPRKRSKSATPELNEDERDRRTVFVQQLAARLRTKELITFFEKVGPVKEAQIVKDRVSGRSKGVGYVEFKNEESVQAAIQLTGQKLLGIPIIAQLTEAEKNRQSRTGDTNNNPNQVPFHRLYVGNIHFSITESDLQNVFEPFGELEFVQLQKDEQGRSRGYGFVQFRDPNQAREALEKMNGFDLAGRPIRVGLGNDKFTPESTANLLQRFGGHGQGQHGFQGSSFSGAGGRGAHAGGAGGNFDRAGGKDTEKGTGGASALDDTDVAGVNFNNYSRDALMRKLARTDEPASDPKADTNARTVRPRTEPKPLPVNVSMASRSIVLKNMFDPAKNTGPEWQHELEQDVREELVQHGEILHLALDPNSDGDIYVKFDSVSAGEKAIKSLNGRFFDGRVINASPVVDAVYNSLYRQQAV